MLNEVFSKFANIQSAIDNIKQLQYTHDNLILTNSKLFDSVLEKFNYYELSADKKIERLSKLIDSRNAKSSFSDDFINEKNVINNQNFILLSDKGAFKLAPSETKVFSTNNNYYAGYISDNSCYLLYNFDEEKTFNNLITSFYDGISFILPYSIKYIYQGIEYDLLENFERFFDRKLEVQNTYYFFPKKAEALKFYFRCSSSNLQVKKIDTILETFPNISSLTLKYVNPNPSGDISITHNFHDKFSSLKIYYYISNSFKELKFEKNKAVIPSFSSKELLLKVEHNSSNISSDNTSVLDTEIVTLSPSADTSLYSSSLVGKFEKVVTDDTFKITISLATLKAIKEYLPEFAKAINDEFVVDSQYIRILGLNDSIPTNHIENLSELNDVSLLELFKKELFVYSPTDKILYFANFLNKDNLKFTVHYQKEIYQDVSGIDNYSPYLFDITIS